MVHKLSFYETLNYYVVCSIYVYTYAICTSE